MRSPGTVDKPSPLRRAPPPKGYLSSNFKFADCEAIESAVWLTPPALIDKLCKGEFLPPVSGEAIFVEELLEIARKLGRMHLVTIIKGDP